MIYTSSFDLGEPILKYSQNFLEPEPVPEPEPEPGKIKKAVPEPEPEPGKIKKAVPEPEPKPEPATFRNFRITVYKS